ncbi:5'/3'-nucleotidase SurE [Halalkalibacter oceani]|uniref:5'-nucleotidase SurE n=1 Tax=Halalkalibacter oceani TaxID=1653776 RepID=A0A9X2IPX6_9BACI|nr:5'/3'-nucleotidase SurE [Halalkalibacter oceani]MCM3714023.1 5'/3'-nucleotidase SurE [Halalkalibacter oceani]MCM3760487.1 5'/3'-nucleotidase SurE [Halalkalibacter oceani]
MKFLVTNDDGIFAPGVEALVEVLQHFGDIYVVCPDQERSAISHSITLRQPLKATTVTLFGAGVKAWAVNGTPADCVKLGVEVLVKEKPDLVISGINIGPNLGRDVYYSGTMAAAAEASLLQIPAIAVSLDRLQTKDTSFQMPKRLLYEVIEPLLSNRIPPGVFVNVNLPYLEKHACSGIKVVPLDLSVSRYKYVGLNDPYGQVYYWLKDHIGQLTEFEEEGDFAKLKAGYVTVTPLEGKVSQKKHVRRFEKWFSNHKLHFSKEETFS